MGTFARIATASLALLAVGGCAATQMTLAQELAWERWKMCDRFPTVTLKEIQTDGQIWVWTHHGSDLAAWRECDEKARKEQASRRVAVATTVAAPGPPVAVSSSTSIGAPTPLRPGSEWAYRWESPQGKGTFVYLLDREEIKDGHAWYVIKSGTRELHVRKSDLALALDVVDGEIEMRRSPPIELLRWPLAVGADVHA